MLDKHNLIGDKNAWKYVGESLLKYRLFENYGKFQNGTISRAKT